MLDRFILIACFIALIAVPVGGIAALFAITQPANNNKATCDPFIVESVGEHTVTCKGADGYFVIEREAGE